MENIILTYRFMGSNTDIYTLDIHFRGLSTNTDTGKVIP